MTLSRRLLPPCILFLATLLVGCGGGVGGTTPGAAGGGAAGTAGAPATSTGATAATGAPAVSTGATSATGATTTSDPGAGGAPGSADTLDTVDALNAAIGRDHGNADWFGDITAITMETLLGAPVLVVRTTLSTTAADYEAVNKKRNDIATALAEYDQVIAPNVAMLDADFFLAPVGSGGMRSVPLYEKVALPERPTTADAVGAWLAAVYGPGGLVTLGPDEAWLRTLKDIRYEDPGWGSGKMLWVETSLPTYRSIDAKLLEKALLTTGSPLLEDWFIETKDGSGSAGGASGAKDAQVGNDGFFYLP